VVIGVSRRLRLRSLARRCGRAVRFCARIIIMKHINTTHRAAHSLATLQLVLPTPHHCGLIHGGLLGRAIATPKLYAAKNKFAIPLIIIFFCAKIRS
jgi:hypothetical protein